MPWIRNMGSNPAPSGQVSSGQTPNCRAPSGQALNGRAPSGRPPSSQPSGQVTSPTPSPEATSHGIPSSLQELLFNPARRNQPRLDPPRTDRKNTLWFKIHPEINAAIKAAYQTYFPGPYRNVSMVPPEVKNQWFMNFVQKFYWHHHHHEEVKAAWDRSLQTLLSNIICKAKKSKKRPLWLSEANWNLMHEYWASPEGKQRSETVRKNCLSDKDGLGRHVHTSGSKSYLRVLEEMELDTLEGSAPPSITDVIIKTHTRKDGSFIDKRAEQIVADIQTEATQMVLESQGSIDPLQANRKSYEKRVPLYKGNSFGMGSIHHFEKKRKSASVTSMPPPPDPELHAEITSLKQRIDGFDDRLLTMDDRLIGMTNLLSIIATQVDPNRAPTNIPSTSNQSANPSPAPTEPIFDDPDIRLPPYYDP